MKSLRILAGVVMLSLAACKKDKSMVVSEGLYTESSPVPGRSQLDFISGSLVVRLEAGSTVRDTFRYSFTSDKILLTATWRSQPTPTPLDFKKLDDRSFQIENLYPSIPEDPKSYMIYKR